MHVLFLHLLHWDILDLLVHIVMTVLHVYHVVVSFFSGFFQIFFGLLPCFLEFSDVIFYQLVWGFLFGEDTLKWMSASCYHEWWISHGWMLPIVMTKLSNWQPVYPIILSFVDIDSEIFFQFLIYPFSLSIHLWMICHWGIWFDSQFFV